jgi:hypothetical protein
MGVSRPKEVSGMKLAKVATLYPVLSTRKMV